MFAELIFVVLAIFGLLLIDNFSTSCALITCVLAVYYYVDYFPFVLNKYAVVFVAAKIWATLTSCYRVGKNLFSLFQKIFTSQKIPVPPPLVSNQFCEYEGGVEHEIKILVSKVSQYYIHSWYDKISSNEQFVSYLNSSINDTLVSLCTSISKVDKKKFSYVILQIYLNFLSHFVEAKKKSEVFKRENFKMKHWAMKDKVTEWCYLQSLVSALLDSFCPSECERSLHSKYSPVLHSVVVEILTENLIHPLVNVLCNPTRLNLMLLKVLLNYVNTNGDKTMPSVCKSPQKDTTAPPNEDCKNKPTILLPNEVLPNNYVGANSTKMKSRNFLSVPDSSALNQIQKETSKFFIERNNEIAVTDNTPLFSSGIKSSSNINISDHNFHNDSGTLDCDSYPSFACDTTIKRSRSADYIRQIKPVCANSQLKALNEKDYNIILQSETNKMVVALKLDTHSGNSIEEAEEAVEFEGQTLFTDIKITDTFLQNEAGLIPYTLYCIQYIGVFHDTGNSTDTPHLVKKVICIKRRFKEFVELHSKIEDNPSLKNYLKGIRGPNKWLILPFSNLDKKNIADRKIFLENYLKELCSSIPIAQSPELHKFLAYGDEERMSYARKSTDATVPRIDKILVRGVKSAFDMFKTVVPLEEDVFSSETVLDDAIPDLKFQEHLLDVCSREPEIDEHARNFLENSSFQLFSEDSKIAEPDPKKSSLRSIHLKNTGCCRCPPLPGNRFFEEKYPLANTIFELIAVAFKLNETTSGDMSSVLKLACFTIVKLLCVPNIDRIFSSKLDNISEEHLTACVHMLHKYLWPDEKCLNQTKEGLEDEANLNTIMEYMEVILSSQSIIQNVNFAVKRMLLEKINLFLSSIQQQETNRCLLYHVFDVIVETVCSNET